MPSFALTLIGVIFLLVGLITWFSHGTSMNRVIGYRTRRSMKNEETWSTGNKLFGRNIIFTGIIYIITGSVLWKMESILTALINAVVFLAGLGLSIYLTERYLQKKYELNN